MNSWCVCVIVEAWLLLFGATLAQVTMCLSSYFELRPCRPRIEKLKQLLRECPYSGPEYEVEPETVVGDEEEETEELREREEEDREAKRRKMNKDAPKKVGLYPSLQSHYSFSFLLFPPFSPLYPSLCMC